MQDHTAHNLLSQLPQVLIIDDMHESILNLKNEFQVDYRPTISSKEALAEMPKYDVVIVRSKIELSSAVLHSLKNVKLIARAGAGMDNIDLSAADQLKISVVNCGEGNRMAVAEHTLGMMLGLTSRIVKAHQEVATLKWDREGNRGVEVGEHTIGIIGFGNTGSALGQLLKGFPGRVMAYDKYKMNYTAGYDHVEEVDLTTIQREADIVSFHVPWTDETNNWINLQFLSSFKKFIYLLNMSRGGIMRLGDIQEALKNNQLLGFATDVLPNEKWNEWSTDEQEVIQSLASDDRVIMTPHVAGWTEESYRKISEILGAKIRSRWKELSARNLK